MHTLRLQLGRASVNIPRLVLRVGETSTLQAGVPEKLKSPLFEHMSGGFTLARPSCMYS